MRCELHTFRTELARVMLGRARRPAELPDLAEWLTPRETAAVATYRSRERREGWLAGRILAKQLVRAFLEDDGLAPSEIEILSRDGDNRGVRPVVAVRGEERPLSLSISHSEHLVVAACADGGDVSLGIDLTLISEVKPHALLAWFTPLEKARLADEDLTDVAECWAMKEAVYKATNQGEPFAPLRIEVAPCDRADSSGWKGHVKDLPRPVEDISTWFDEGHVAALAVAPWTLLAERAARAEHAPALHRHAASLETV